MRDYASMPLDLFSLPNWRLVRGDCEAMAVGLYLWSCAHSNMLGAYRLPPAYVAADLGLDVAIVKRAILRLIEAEACVYDEAESFIFVPDMGAWQCQGEIKAADNRIKALKKLWDRVPQGSVRDAVLARYGQAFHLASGQGDQELAKDLGRPFEGASKALRSQEQEQKPEQEGESPARAQEASPKAQSAAQALTAAGCPDASAFDPLLQAVITEIPTLALVDLAKQHPGKSLKYLISTYRGRQADAKRPGAMTCVVGPGPTPAANVQVRAPESQEVANAEARKRWLELGAPAEEIEDQLASSKPRHRQGATR